MNDYHALIHQRDNLDTEIRGLRQKSRKRVIKEIQEAMKLYRIRQAEIGDPCETRPTARAKAKRGVFEDPNTGRVWHGVGDIPSWVPVHGKML